MKHIVLTGNIGCGKSFISNILWDKRYQFTEPPNVLINMDHETFFYVYGEGRQYMIDNFLTLDKRTISQLVFEHPQLLADLNAHYAPHVKELFRSHTNDGMGPHIVEFPLLYESFATPKERQFIKDNCIVVAITADAGVRYARAAERDKKTPQQIHRIDTTQMHQNEKSRLADVTIANTPWEWNEGSADRLIGAINEIVKRSLV